MAKNIVIGVGNLLFCDDGIGIIAVSYLNKNFSFSPGLEILDGGTLGFNLIEYFVDYDNVLIIDTVSMNDEAGSIYKIPSEELLGGNGYKNTAHEVEVLQMLEACELYDSKSNITIIGTVPQDIDSMKIGLSKTLQEKFGALIDNVIDALEQLDVKVTRVSHVTLEEIVKEFKV
jgi:hydrogenase maturation protease